MKIKNTQSAVAEAIRNGTLVRQACEVCGSTVKVHGHHSDYTKPLEVMWLCATHHKEEHARLRLAGIEIPGADDRPGKKTFNLVIPMPLYRRLAKVAHDDRRDMQHTILAMLELLLCRESVMPFFGAELERVIQLHQYEREV